jgi:hypothetical protein
MSYKKHLAIVVISLVIVIGIFIFTKQSANACGAYEKSSLKFSDTVVAIEIADTDCKQALGLSGRKSLPENAGMLFLFPESGSHGMWMKDMLFPIDIIWFGPDSTILGVEQNVATSTFPKTFGDNYISKYVLELPAGFVSKHGMVQ